MTVMAGEFLSNIERRRVRARAQLSQRAGAAPSPWGARRSRNWSDREDFQERTDIELCGWSRARAGGPCDPRRQRDEGTRVAAQSSGASITGALILLASSCQAPSASSAKRNSRKSAGEITPA